MKLTDLISLSSRNYIMRPMRTFLTILGVSVGIGTILFLVSLGYGIQKIILERITTNDSLLSLEVSPPPSDVIKLDKEAIDKIKKMPEISEISPIVSYSGQINHANLTGDSLIFGADSSYFRLSGLLVKNGKIYDEKSTDGSVITTAGLNLLNINEKEAVGKELKLMAFIPYKNEEGVEEIKIVEPGTVYKITGVIDNNDNSYVYIPLGSLSELAITDYNQIQIKVFNSEQMEIVRKNIIEQGYIVSALSDIIDQANKIFRIMQIVLALFGLIALVVSAIGMFNTMTITLLERINEIGIMRAIGATRFDIRWLFLIESTLMGLLGGIGGVLVGLVTGQIVNIGLNVLAKNFGGQAVNLFYSPSWFIFFIIIFSTIIGFVTGIYPSHRAAKLNPLDALRYK